MRGFLRSCRKWVASNARRIQTCKRLRRDDDEAHAARFKVLEVLNGRVEELMIGGRHGRRYFNITGVIVIVTVACLMGFFRAMPSRMGFL